ncbi:MAG: glycosyltransferase [Lachnospiraceae bacterium]|nr:glycosyltransferase [Lachnospiraceae bacterium]
MKICFIAPADNYHTRKWCTWFQSKGHMVDVISFTNAIIENVNVHWIDSGVDVQESDGKKIKYLLQFIKVNKLVKEIKPDIVNVHYATSYGTVVALSGIKKYVLSVWGSDIYQFPQKSIFHKMMLKYSLRKATYLFSTSNAMAKEGRKYTNKPFEITPFGVDMDLFSPKKRNREEDGNFVVGTIKTLAPKYGIDYLLKAVSIVRHENLNIPIQLRIAGKGLCEDEYKQLADQLEIADITTWLGFVSQEQAAQEWSNMDLAIIYSSAEAFGVSAVEAQACEVPVIISDVPGLMEATALGCSSMVVPRMNERALADAILVMYNDEQKRSMFGKNGRKYVKEKYEFDFCFRKIEQLFCNIIDNS